MSTLYTRIIGTGFLTAFVLYGGGTALVESASHAIDGAGAIVDQPGRVRLGVLAILANSVVVATIGAVAHPFFRQSRPAVANGYLIGRLFEAVVLAVGGLFLLLAANTSEVEPALTATLIEGNNIAYAIGLVGLGFASVPFFWFLAKDGLVPRLFGPLGVAGYLLLIAGMLRELLDLGSGVLFAVPGGLVEVVFGLWLLWRGVPSSGSERRIAKNFQTAA